MPQMYVTSLSLSLSLSLFLSFSGIYACICVCLSLYVYVCMYMYIYIFIYIYHSGTYSCQLGSLITPIPCIITLITLFEGNQMQKGSRFSPIMLCQREECKAEFCFIHSNAHVGMYLCIHI